MINAEFTNHHPQFYRESAGQPPGKKLAHQGRSIDLPDYTTGHLSDTLEEKKEGAIDTLPAVKGKRSVKPVSREIEFYRKLLEYCLPVDKMGLGGRQRGKEVSASKDLIRDAVSKFFQSLKKAEGLSANSGSVEGDQLLTQLAKSPSGERLYRKAAAKNLGRIECVLRSAGVDINHQSKKSGGTPLIAAVLNHHWDMMYTLVESGAVASVSNKSDQHVLKLIFDYRSKKKIDDKQCQDLVLKVLTEQKDNEKIKQSGGEITLSVYAFRQAVMTGDTLFLGKLLFKTPNTMQELMKNREAQEVLTLLVTCPDNLSHVVKYLLDVKDRWGNQVFNPDYKGRSGKYPLMMAAKYGKCETMKVLLNDPTVIATINDPKMVNGRKWTAYTFAHSRGSRNMMEQLASKGAIRLPAPPPLPHSGPTSGSRYSSSPLSNDSIYYGYGDGGCGSYSCVCGGSSNDCGGF